jgi:hypothetical protein
VKKTSGDVWMGSGDVRQVSLKSDEVLKPGDTVTTGKNGRVLLVRGEESILIAPNSMVGLPAEKKEGLTTTIKQQAGSILLEVEKKNVKHFEVETPYLAAVVKGTQFRVTVNASGATVDVVRGQVEVADFKTGQIAQVMPGQHANVFANGNAGLTLGGAGSLQPIQQGQPRASSVNPVTVPRNGLTAPGKPTSASLQQKPGSASAQQNKTTSGPRSGVVRISASLGEVKLNVHRATHGLARSASLTTGARSVARNENSTVWGPGDGASNSSTSSSSNASSGGSSSDNGGSGGGNGGSGSSGGGGNSGASGAVAGVVGATGGVVSGVVSGVGGVIGSVTGNGNNGNGNGNGNNGLHLGLINGRGLR